MHCKAKARETGKSAATRSKDLMEKAAEGRRERFFAALLLLRALSDFRTSVRRALRGSSASQAEILAVLRASSDFRPSVRRASRGSPAPQAEILAVGRGLVSRETRYTAVKVHGIHIHSLEMERFRSLPLSTSYSAILKFLKQTQKEAPSGLGRNSTCSLIMVSLR